MIVIVTGSRDWTDQDLITSALQAAVPDHQGPISPTLVHGGARGADRIAARIAEGWGWLVKAYPAHWREFGKAAGMIRNRQMLIDHPGAMIVAFPLAHSVGTYGMIEEARRRGHQVRVYTAAPKEDR